MTARKLKFPSIFPRDHRFNDLLEGLTVQVLSSVRNLKNFMDASGTAQISSGNAISADKAKAKAIFNEITEELCRSFVTPFDREDIHDLAQNLYKIAKIIEKVKERILLHRLSNQQGDFSRQVDLIVREAQAMDEMIKALLQSKNNSKIVENATLLQDIEHQGDQVRNELMAALFTEDRDVRDLILRRDIYDMLEKAVDRFRDVAGIALQIVLKHS